MRAFLLHHNMAEGIPGEEMALEREEAEQTNFFFQKALVN